jgi:protein tyrosine/serine phosphatase
MTKHTLPPVIKFLAHKRGAFLFACALIFALSGASFASSDRGKAFHSGASLTVSVENFGKVTEVYYRGAQPEREEYEQLASLGVKTIIDLRHDPKSYAKSSATQAGLKYINFPMSDKQYPAADTATKFLALIKDAANLPVYVHCAGGRHRTGIMTAVFRMTEQGWDINRAYEEMKDYDFYTRWGHKPMKTFIFDFYRDLQKQRDVQLVNVAADEAAPVTRIRRVSEVTQQQ